MPAASAFHYATIRVVPDVEREEFVNAGVLLFCDELGFLGARIELDPARVRLLAPNADVPLVEEHLAAIPRVCAGGPDAGPIGLLPMRERWHWLVSPRSSIIQTSAPHAGLCDDPERVLERLFERMVLRPER